jgi:hypothetical protein
LKREFVVAESVSLIEKSNLPWSQTHWRCMVVLGAEHAGCSPLGNDLFAYFESTDSKSRLSFLQILQGSRRHYAINDMALAYWARQKLAAALVDQLTQGPQEFDGEQAWQAWLAELAITDERHVRIAGEGALLGGLIARGVSPNLVVLSDGAPQFVVFVHAGCWVQVSSPIHRTQGVALGFPVSKQSGRTVPDSLRQADMPVSVSGSPARLERYRDCDHHQAG